MISFFASIQMADTMTYSQYLLCKDKHFQFTELSMERFQKNEALRNLVFFIIQPAKITISKSF